MSDPAFDEMVAKLADCQRERDHWRYQTAAVYDNYIKSCAEVTELTAINDKVQLEVEQLRQRIAIRDKEVALYSSQAQAFRLLLLDAQTLLTGVRHLLPDNPIYKNLAVWLHLAGKALQEEES